jgi:hypothetical protein
MHPCTRRTAITYGTLAAIFVVAGLGALVVSRQLLPHAGMARAPSADAPPVFKTAAARMPKSYNPAHRDHVATLLHPAIVTIRAPETIGLGDSARITLTIEHDHADAGKASFPRSGSALARMPRQTSDDGVIGVYHAQAGDRVTAHLYGASSDAPLPSRDDNPLMVSPEGPTTWTWHVTGSEPGALDLEFEMFANYTFESTPGAWPLGTISAAMSVDPTLPQWIKYSVVKVLAAWEFFVAFAGGIGGIAAVWPIVRTWPPFRARHESAPDVQAHA